MPRELTFVNFRVYIGLPALHPAALNLARLVLVQQMETMYETRSVSQLRARERVQPPRF